MTAHKRFEITIETDRILILRRHRSMRAYCAKCGCEVDMMDEGEAGAVAGISGQALRDLAQVRGWHLSEGTDGTALVCLSSLLRST
jgi:hypothetical protein